MYYPVQIPFVLNEAFSKTVRYSEEIIPSLQDFVICLWEMQPLLNVEKTVENIIITDGCIDIVAEYGEKIIGFAGMSKTDKCSFPPSCSLGARFKPGAFHAITNIPANEAMDNFLPINNFDKNFDVDFFFSLDLAEAKKFLINYIENLIKNKNTNKFIELFDKLNDNIPESATEIFDEMCYSPRQCQRHFQKNYGLSPQMVLCILRFQKCLKNIISQKNSKSVMDISNYYDQSHFINDFKRNIGLTPLELLRKYSA